MLFRYLLLVLIILMPVTFFGNNPFRSAKPLNQLTEELVNARTTEEKIESYGQLGHYYNAKRYDVSTADSLYLEAIQLAKTTFDKRLIIKAYSQFLEDVQLGNDNPEVLRAINELSEMTKSVTTLDEKFDLCLIACDACLTVPNCQDFSNHSMQLSTMASQSSDKERKAKAYRIIARSLQKNNNYESAFDYFLKSREIIAQLGEKSGAESYYLNGDLFSFYYEINYFEEAAEHKRAQIQFLRDNSPVDSNALMWLNYDLVFLAVNNQLEGAVENNLQTILEYSKRAGDNKLFNYAQSIYRTYLLENHELKKLKDFYMVKYPDELLAFQKEDTANFYTISALINEYDDNIDSAMVLFERAEEIVNHSRNKYLISNFYLRYGEFLSRQKNHASAADKFTRSYEISSDLDYHNYMLPAARYLDQAYVAQSDYKNAYKYKSIYENLLDERNTMLHEGDMLRKELESQERLNLYESEKEYEKKKKKYSLQYFIIVVGIIIAFIALVIVSSLTVPEWLIEMLGFFSILSIFEFIILLLDTELHHWAHGAPLKIFLMKIAILSILFPLHHVIEQRVVKYMKANRLIGKPNWRQIVKALSSLYPWMSKENKSH